MGLFEEHLELAKERAHAYFVENFPEVRRIEEFEGFEGLRVAHQRYDHGVASIHYETRAPTLFPHVRKSLIERGVVKAHQVKEAAKMSHDRYQLRLGFYGSRLQLNLDLRRE